MILEDSGVWITPLDYLGIKSFSDVPIFNKALPAPQEGVYGGFPYYLPLRHVVRYSTNMLPLIKSEILIFDDFTVNHCLLAKVLT